MSIDAPQVTSSGLDRIEPGRLSRLVEALASAPDVAPPPPLPSPGDRLGRFVVLRELGRGGFGVVFEAEDLELHRRVALKLVRGARAAAGSSQEWVRREAEAAAQLQHPAIVTLHDAGEWEGSAFLVYELLRGETLAERLAAAPLRRPEARSVLRVVAGALAHAHAAGVVHRDLKPGNVFLGEDGAVKLLDLGLAQVAGAAGIAAGSPTYAAPEQWAGGAVDARADVHAWGVMAGELLGAPPERTRHRRGTLRALAAAARDPDPARRPADGAALVRALDGIERRRRVARLGAGLLASVALGLAGAWLARPPPASPPGPMRVALADAENVSGDARLDGLEGLIAAGLSASPRLEVLDRSRLAAALRASGRPGAERVDAGPAALAARLLGAAALLLPGARAEGAGWRLSLEARDPESGRVLFAVEEATAGPGALLGGVDRLVRRARAALREREGDIRATEVEVSRAVSRSLEAYQRYHQGKLCVERPSQGRSWLAIDCDAHFRAALAIDPDFALAHFELARLTFLSGASTEAIREAMAPAVARAERMPPRERDQLRAWQAWVEGDEEGAATLARGAAAAFPGDVGAVEGLGDLLFRLGRLTEAVSPLEQTVALDPGRETALDELTWALGLLDRREALTALAERLARLPPTPGLRHAEVHARGWAGDLAGALAVARRAAEVGGEAAEEDLTGALAAAGMVQEAEGRLRAAAAREVAGARSRLASLLFLQGRRREALELLERELRDAASPQERFVLLARRALHLAGERNVGDLGRDAATIRPHSLELAATLAPLLAYAGDERGARELLPHIPGRPAAAEVTEALATWRSRGAVAALPDLRRLAEGDPGGLREVLPPEAPRWLHAECAAEAGELEEALGALQRFQRAWRPLGPWRSWAHPRGLLLEARLLDFQGRRGAAREVLARLEDLWARADPGQALGSDLRALRRRLGTAEGASVSPGPGSRVPF